MGTRDSLGYTYFRDRLVIESLWQMPQGTIQIPSFREGQPEDAFSYQPSLGTASAEGNSLPQGHASFQRPPVSSDHSLFHMVLHKPGPLAQLEMRLKGHFSSGLPVRPTEAVIEAESLRLCHISTSPSAPSSCCSFLFTSIDPQNPPNNLSGMRSSPWPHLRLCCLGNLTCSNHCYSRWCPS